MTDPVKTMKITPVVALAIALSWAGPSVRSADESKAETLDEVHERFVSASKSFDLDAAREVLARAHSVVESLSDSSPAVEFEVRAALLVAELERLAFERLPQDAREARSEIGKRIDVAAKAALAQVQTLPESSERWRLEADLLGTMIRSDFRAKKFQKSFEEGVRQATQLDAKNPNAWVTSAKPLIFAGPKHGQDFDGAVRLLDRALELTPGLEPALLLRGLAEERRGAPQRAAADWRAALDANPDCEPAREGLERLTAELQTP